MTRAVHGLEGEGLLLHLEGEHVLAVVLPVSRGLPQLAVVDVGRHHLLEAPLPVLALRRESAGCLVPELHQEAPLQLCRPGVSDPVNGSLRCLRLDHSSHPVFNELNLRDDERRRN